MKKILCTVWLLGAMSSQVFSMENPKQEPTQELTQEEQDLQQAILDTQNGASTLIQKTYRAFIGKKHAAKDLVTQNLQNLMSDFLSGQISKNKFFRNCQNLPKSLRSFVFANYLTLLIENFGLKDKLEDFLNNLDRGLKNDLGTIINALDEGQNSYYSNILRFKFKIKEFNNNLKIDLGALLNFLDNVLDRSQRIEVSDILRSKFHITEDVNNEELKRIFGALLISVIQICESYSTYKTNTPETNIRIFLALKPEFIRIQLLLNQASIKSSSFLMKTLFDKSAKVAQEGLNSFLITISSNIQVGIH